MEMLGKFRDPSHAMASRPGRVASRVSHMETLSILFYFRVDLARRWICTR
jgi:hypothetical protein